MLNIIIQLKTKTKKENVITQYIEINMYNIHAHIESKENTRTEKKKKDTYIEELILYH